MNAEKRQNHNCCCQVEKCAAQTQFVAPEGGYGWIIVFSYAIANLIVIPTTSNFGLIFKDKFEQMQMPAADLTLIININSALSMSLGFFNGPLLRSFGYRKVSVVASLVFALGLIMTSMVDTVFGFIITYGVITAVGYGLSNSSFALALNSFFRVRLNRASGVAMTIAGIGLIVYPPMIQHLIDTYDVDGCMLIIGGIALNMLVAAVLLQPIKRHLVPQSSNNEFKSICSLCNPQPLPTVMTFQSIGKFSNVSHASNCCGICDRTMGDHAECRSHFPIDHDIDTQSIYGVDQIVHRQPSFALPNQEKIARNFSRRTLCNNPTYIGTTGLGVTSGLSCSNANFTSFPSKPMGWFGSTGSVHVDSRSEVQREQGQDRKQSTTFSPFRRESMLKITLKKHALSPNVDGEENNTKNSLSYDDNDDGAIYVPQVPAIMINDNYEQQSHKPFVSMLNWFIHFFDLDLLNDKIYLNLMIGMAISIFGEINFAILTPFILTDLSYGTKEIPMIISITAVADLISRFFSPFVADYFQWSTRTAYLVSLILLIFTRTGMLFATNYMEMIIAAIVLGIAKGVRNVYMSIVIPSYVTIDRLAGASGIQMMANGLAMLLLGPLLGLIRDLTGSYSCCIIFINFITLITVLMYTTEMCCTAIERRREDNVSKGNDV